MTPRAVVFLLLLPAAACSKLIGIGDYTTIEGSGGASSGSTGSLASGSAGSTAGSGAGSSVASTGTGMRPTGAPCTQALECSSDHCVDGVCCDMACDASCSGCKNADTGQPDGTCGHVTGPDPRGVCVPACTGESVSNAACNQGQCEASGMTPCFPFTCKAGACTTTCSSSADCALTAFCDGNGSTCKADLGDGKGCTMPDECASGHCVHDVCCNTACLDQACQACVKTLTGLNDGMCGVVSSGTDPYGVCTKPKTCIMGLCQ